MAIAWWWISTRFSRSGTSPRSAGQWSRRSACPRYSALPERRAICEALALDRRCRHHRARCSLGAVAMVMDISVHVDVRRLTRNLGALADKQIPFATAQALNALGNIVKAEET